MTDLFIPVTSLADLDAALARSAHGPIILFKHSPTCGISAQAHADLMDWLPHTGHDVPAYLVQVRAHREVSDAVTDRFRVRHESPQLLVIDGGTVHWHGSHWHVNAREVAAALAKRPMYASRTGRVPGSQEALP